ncbi:HNH endonuclease signature motif containing protein, partial [Pseudothauera rhizosphaerae]
LLIETLQDVSRYTSKQSSSGLDLSLCIPPICYGSFVQSAAYTSSKQQIKHNYRSAVGQSGIAAGEGGFDITVQGGTELVGAAITSAAPAEQNTLTTASLTSRDLENIQSTQSSSSSVGFSYAAANTATTNLAHSATNTLLPNLDANAALPEDRDETSQTLSVISPANITLTGTGDETKDQQSQRTAEELTTRDPSTANQSLTNALTLQQAQVLEQDIREHRENQEAAKLVGAVLAGAVGDLAKKYDWEEGSPQKLALHGLVGLISAKVGDGNLAAGALAGAGQELLAKELSAYLKENGYDYNEAGISSEEAVKRKAEHDSLLQLGAALAGAAVGTLAGDTQGAATGASTAFVGVTNNYLSHAENEERRKAARACADGDEAACKTRDEWNALDQRRDTELRDACYANGSSAECSVKYAEMLVALDSYSGKGDAEYVKDLKAGLEKYTALAERESFKNVINVPHYDEQAIALVADVIRFTGNLALDLTPGVGDAKAVAEAEAKFDYALAIIGALGPVGDGAKALIKEAKALYEAGETVKAVEKIAEVNRGLINESNHLVKKYVDDIEIQTGYRLGDVQRSALATEVRNVDHSVTLTPAENAILRGEFNSQRAKLIAEWEQQTGQKWPTVEVSRNGQVTTQLAQAHHVIPVSNGGPAAWWNIIPATQAQHTAIHKGPLKDLQSGVQ